MGEIPGRPFPSKTRCLKTWNTVSPASNQSIVLRLSQNDDASWCSRLTPTTDHFTRYAPEHIEYGVNRYQNETRRLYSVLDKHLAADNKPYLCGEKCTIAGKHFFRQSLLVEFFVFCVLYPWTAASFTRRVSNWLILHSHRHFLPNMHTQFAHSRMTIVLCDNTSQISPTMDGSLPPVGQASISMSSPRSKPGKSA